ncbi:MAG TPA: hypothetical protein VGQ20_15780, partial [Acidimicrobiales bacterium]|nr:hypothetical protein [Acidimicrobiales bacterium]
MVVVALAALPIPVLAAPASSAASVQPRPALLVRSISTGELGIPRPTGIAYSNNDAALLVASATGSQIVKMAPAGDLLGPAPTAFGDALTLAFDPTAGAASMLLGKDLLKVAGTEFAVDGASRKLGALDLGTVTGAAYDSSGALLVLDASSHRILRVEDSAVRSIPLKQLAAADLRGLAFNPNDGLVYVGDPANELLHGIDGSGTVQSVYDLSDANLADPQSFTFAPSADPTDAPATLSLYVADTGGSSTTGQIAEMSLVSEPVALAVTAESSVLVQTINGWQWSPPNPDASGITYMPDVDRLMVSDGEVEEMTIFQGVNLFTTTRTGTLTDTGVTTAFSVEPTGVSYRQSDRTLFVSDDNQRRINFIKPGPDNLHGTADD